MNNIPGGTAFPIFKAMYNIIKQLYSNIKQSLLFLMVKNPPVNAGVLRTVGLILRTGRSPGRRHGK